MTPVFTVHAGEYLVGTHLARIFRGCRIWIPAKDSGIDLLVTDSSCSRAVSLQVKYSRDYPDPAFRSIAQSSFFSVQRRKIESSPAGYWVIVLHSFTSKKSRFLIIPPRELLRRIELHCTGVERLITFIFVSSAIRQAGRFAEFLAERRGAR